MAKTITTKKLASNLTISLFAQIISLAVSFLLNLIVPKFIDEYSYSYWQTYVMYAGYVVVLHFGLLDGIMLRYSAYDYNELDRARLRSQFELLLAVISFFAILLAVVAGFAFKGQNRIIFVLVAASILLKNLTMYNSYTFQITNRINKYAMLVIIQRGVYGIVAAVLLLCRVNHFYWYCIADLMGEAVSFVLGVIFNRGAIYIGKTISLRETFKEAKVNVSAGIVLMFANWSASLMVSGAKQITQWRWDDLLFGKVTFAFSLTNVFLTCVSAVSVVLFPSLKRINKDELPEMYKNIRNLISPLLFFAMLAYFPGCWILNKWLPQYSQSLGYLALLLPLIIFSSKVNLLTNNYLKVYRKERIMLIINLSSVIVGLAAFALCAYAFNNLVALLLCVVGIIMINSVASEIAVMKLIGIRFVKDFIFEFLLTVGFIAVAYNLSLLYGFLAYLAMFVVYCALNYKSVFGLLNSVLHRLKRKKQ